MGEEEANPLWVAAPDQFVPQVVDARSGIDNDELPGGRSDSEAGGVAAETDG
jgi:hypothetical protein